MPEKLDGKAMFKLSYGLFVLTARDGAKDNGCIINTAAQLTSSPMRISITVNKANYTHDMIQKTGVFNVSILSESTPFSVFQQYGFQSGRTADKLSGKEPRTENGVAYLAEHANAVISGKVISTCIAARIRLFIADGDGAMCSPRRRPPLMLTTLSTSSPSRSPLPKRRRAMCARSAVMFTRVRPFRRISSARCASTARTILNR